MPDALPPIDWSRPLLGQVAELGADYDRWVHRAKKPGDSLRIFENGHWNFTEDNADLHTLHHLGAGKFVVAGNQLQARQD